MHFLQLKTYEEFWIGGSLASQDLTRRHWRSFSWRFLVYLNGFNDRNSSVGVGHPTAKLAYPASRPLLPHNVKGSFLFCCVMSSLTCFFSFLRKNKKGTFQLKSSSLYWSNSDFSQIRKYRILKSLTLGRRRIVDVLQTGQVDLVKSSWCCFDCKSASETFDGVKERRKLPNFSLSHHLMTFSHVFCCCCCLCSKEIPVPIKFEMILIDEIRFYRVWVIRIQVLQFRGKCLACCHFPIN